MAGHVADATHHIQGLAGGHTAVPAHNDGVQISGVESVGDSPELGRTPLAGNFEPAAVEAGSDTRGVRSPSDLGDALQHAPHLGRHLLHGAAGSLLAQRLVVGAVNRRVLLGH